MNPFLPRKFIKMPVKNFSKSKPTETKGLVKKTIENKRSQLISAAEEAKGGCIQGL